MAECRLVIIKRNGEDLNEQLLAPGTEWKIGKGVNADIRVRIDGVEEEHGIIKVDNNGKVCVRNFSANNPLMVNGKPFPKEQVINSGDYLSIINRSFRFDIKEPVLQQVTGNALQLTSTPDHVSGKSILLQSRMSGIENYRSSPRPGRSRRSTPGTVGTASRIATPIPSESLYKSWRSSLSVNSSSLDKIQEDGEEGIDGENTVSDVQQCLFAEEKARASDGAPANKPRRSTRRSSIRRSVAFGPALSPEYFDKSLPPNTPLKKGTLPPSASFIGDQLPNELEQIVEEEEAQNSYSELFSTPAKTKQSPTPKKMKEIKPKSPKRSATPIQERSKPATRKVASPVKGTNKIRKSYGGVSKKGTKQKRSSLPTSIKQTTSSKLIGVPAEDSTDGAALYRQKRKDGKEIHTPKTKIKESAKKLEPTKKKGLSESATFSIANRSFVIGDGKGRASKNRRSLPSSVLVEGASDTSLVPYIPVLPTDDVPALPEGQSFEVSTEETEEETEVQLSLPTPLKKSIQAGVSLKQTKPKLWTPLRKDLESGVVLHKLHQILPTPIRKAIASNPILRATKKALATPIRKEIEGQPKLRATKKAMATPIRKEIERQPKLRATKKALATPIRREIEGQPKLRATKKALATPIRKEIEGQPKLRAIKKALATPIRKEIEGKPKLRATKKALATPIRKEIEGQPKLRATKKALATPIRKEIEGQPKLRATKKALATPIRKEIEGQPKLRATKKALATPIRKEIEGQPKLRATKKALATPIRKEIEGQPKLRATKKRMATPLRKDIESKPKLRTVIKSLPTPLKTDIKKKWSLRQTKRRMATPLQKSIKEKPTLRKVMKSLPTPIRQEIESQPTLRQTKKMLPLSVREEILKRPTLKPTRRRMATPLRQAIENAPPLKVTKKNEIVPPTKRRAPKRRQSKGEDDLPPTKKAKAVIATTKGLSAPVEYTGLQRLFKETSKTRCGTPQGDAMYQGVQMMFRTPKRQKDLSPDYEGLADLFGSPVLSTMVTTKKVTFLSPVAMSAKRSTRSTATPLSVNNTMLLNVPKLDYSENTSVRRTRSKEASVPLTLEDPAPTSELRKTSQKRAKSKAQKSTKISPVPEPENDTIPTVATRSLRSGNKSIAPPVDEVASIAAKKKGTSKKAIEEDKEAKEAPVTVTRRTRAAKPVESPTVSPVRQTRQSKTSNSPVRRTRQSKTINQEAATVEIKTTTRKRKTQVVEETNVENANPVVRRTRRSQITEQEVTTAPVSTRKRKAPLKPAENNIESVSVSPVVRRTRSRMTKEQVSAAEGVPVTKKRKASQKVTESNAENVSASPVVRRTRRSKMTKQESVSVSVEPKKVVVTKKTLQEVKESDADIEAAIPAVTRTRQNQIIKVIVPVNAIRHSARLHRK